jgi:uncharacterized lipoprotein YbaY
MPPPAPQPVVTGEIRFEPQAPPFRNATIRVRLEDVSRMDAPARVVAEQVIRGVSRSTPAAAPVPFAVHSARALDSRATYNLRAHVDLNGNGEIEVGDFITMERFPVRPGPAPARLDVLVRRVG